MPACPSSTDLIPLPSRRTVITLVKSRLDVLRARADKGFIMGMKETLIEVLKDLVLPELDALKGQVGKLEVCLTAVEQRLEDFSSRLQEIDLHLVDQSRRIDETNRRIDQLNTDLTGRIDKVNTDLTGRIDKVNADLTGRIDKVNADLTARIDQQTLRIDGLTAQVAALAQGLG